MRPSLLLLSCLLLTGPGFAQTSGKASGTPEARPGQGSAQARVEFDIAQGVAFPGDYQDYDFVLLPAGLAVADLARAIDPQAVLKARADLQGLAYAFGSVRTEGASASAAYVHEGAFGGFLGSGYLFGARIEQGRLRGRLELRDTDKGSFLDATLDAPIVPAASGTPLPADGGAPWRDFVRLRDALRAGKEAPIRALLGATILQQMPRDEPFDTFLSQLVKGFPMDARFASGASTPLDARLVLHDDSSGKPVRCVVTLLPEGDQWRMHQMSFRHGGKPIDPPPPPAVFTDVPTESGG